MTQAKIEVPHVYTAMLAILNELGVAKNGQLPSNMGGKPYITAVDVAREVKTLFVANELIVLPSEHVTKHEVIIHKDRVNIAIGIEGSYTIVSTKDGSTATVTGVGDGLAGGTAVASNIASTNALKNAMLRTFMITEQSVEDAAKNGIDESDKPQPRAVQNAQNGATTAQASKPDTAVQEAQTAVREAWEAVHGVGDIGYVKLGNELNDTTDFKVWGNSIPKLAKLKEAIENGEVA